ncbi:MAG: Exodeoxyribonuclease [Labilithrix sp.]|nr:Exodeoxyribonuclease [Labilithrix sp.]
MSELPEAPDFDESPFDDASVRPLLTCDVDGTHHFSQIKKLSLSGKQYLHACNHPTKPTSAMLLGTLVHFLVLGQQRSGAKRLVRYDGKRQGNAWKDFEAANRDAEILTASEWEEGERIAEAVLADPVARGRLAGARFEVPLVWEEDGIMCSTSGVDIVTARAIGDLKTTTSTHPETWMRQAFRMLYPQQLAWYRRGARAHGLDTTEGLFLLGVETKAPYEVVDLELTERMIDFADRNVSLWLETLRVFRQTNQWPGYAQASVAFDLPAYMQREDADEDQEAAE